MASASLPQMLDVYRALADLHDAALLRRIRIARMCRQIASWEAEFSGVAYVSRDRLRDIAEELQDMRQAMEEIA